MEEQIFNSCELASFSRIEVRTGDDILAFFPYRNDIWENSDGVRYTYDQVCEVIDDYIELCMRDLLKRSVVVGIKKE